MNPTTCTALVGFGAVGQAICHSTLTRTHSVIAVVVVRTDKIASTQAQLTALGLAHITVTDTVPPNATLLLECAGHRALLTHVLPALLRGVPCAVLSVGALTDDDLAAQLEQAAKTGCTQLHLLEGAIGGIDAIAAAKQGGLTAVHYTGRKPPQGWLGSPADAAVGGAFDLLALTQPTVIFQGTARQASISFPKNANVAATLALAGLGLDETQVQLIADPHVSVNIHEVQAIGAFGEMRLEMRGNPLPSNPKTSMLTVLSALRFLHNWQTDVCI